MIFPNTEVSLLGLIAIATLSQGSSVTTYTFPTTDYPEFGIEFPNDGGMVHGLCVLGATEASATISPDSSGYAYTSIPNLKDGTQLWTNSRYKLRGINGNGPDVCEGGIYLQPSDMSGPPSGVDVTIEAKSADEMSGVTICAFIEQPFHGKRGHSYNRSGNWGNSLLDQGFKASEMVLLQRPTNPQRGISYCKAFGTAMQSLKILPSESPTSSPTGSPTSSVQKDITSFTFPTTAYPEPGSEHPNDGGMVHGLCVLGATDATATLSPDSSAYSYKSIPGLKDGIHAFGDRGSQYPLHGIDGHGPQVCEGGIYLQPSYVYGPPPGVDVTVEATPIDEKVGVTICAFIEREFEWRGHHYNRQGNWKQPLIDQGFVASDVQFTFSEPHPGRYTSYCKSFGTSAPSLLSLPSEPSKASPRNDITSFTFPTTAYPEPGSEHPNDGGMVHGLCVLGATDATATLSPDSSAYSYKSIPGLKDGIHAFGDRGSQYPLHGIDGHGPQVCEGGIYLQPSYVYGPPPGVDVTVEATPIDEKVGVTICAFIEREFEWRGHHYNRQGNWKQPLIDQGFVASDVQFTFHQPHNDRFTSYCKSFGTSAPSLLSLPSEPSKASPRKDITSFTFPTTAYPEPGSEHRHDGGMVHGLCVLGATDATATLSPDASAYSYKSIPGLKDGVYAFGDRGSQYPLHGIDGNGPQVCEGGIYLQPSYVYGPPPGVDVTVEATPIDEKVGVTICAFIEREFRLYGHHYNRQGNWKQPLIDQGFVASDVQFTFHQPHNDRFTSYCKSFGRVESKSLSTMKASSATSSPSVFVTSSDLSLISCPEDVKLIRSYGSTEFPSQLSPTPPVSVISQDSGTVTVALNQVWDKTIDRYFFEYNESLFSSKCYEEVGVNPGEVIETITIQCLTMSSSAFLKICLQDEGGNLLTSEDDATVSNCCHSDAPQGTPTACYNLSVNCVTTCGSESSLARSLRGRVFSF